MKVLRVTVELKCRRSVVLFLNTDVHPRVKSALTSQHIITTISFAQSDITSKER